MYLTETHNINKSHKLYKEIDQFAAINIRNEGERIKIGLSSPELTHQEIKPLGHRRMMKENVKIKEFH